MNQQTNAKRLENVPPALLGEVFGFLAPPAQSRLRASSTTLAGAFCGAVTNELVPLAASWHSIDSHVEAVNLGPFVYFPAVPEALRDWERKTVRSAIVSLRLLLRPGRLGVSGALAQVRVERVHIVNASNVYSLGNDFLYRCPFLTHVIWADVRGLAGVETIGNNFLAMCPFLVHGASLAPFVGVVSIGNSCLAGARIDEIRVEHLPKLRTVGALWFAGGRAKTAVFAHLASLHTVHLGWLEDSKDLRECIFTHLPSLCIVHSRWVSRCTALQRAIYTDLPALTAVGFNWMFGCCELRAVEFALLPTLSNVALNWLAHCRALTTVSFCGMPALRTVGGSWLANCKSLTHVDFSGLAVLDSVGMHLMDNCDSLVEVNFTGCTSLTELNPAFVIGNSKLIVIGAESLPLDSRKRLQAPYT
jgi:hypothetical protein